MRAWSWYCRIQKVVSHQKSNILSFPARGEHILHNTTGTKYMALNMVLCGVTYARSSYAELYNNTKMTEFVTWLASHKLLF
jgi:hypothetical protein